MLPTDLDKILTTLTSLEPLYHAACPEANSKDFERLVSADFWEVGASGKTYSRAFALDALQNRPTRPSSDMWQTSEFSIKSLNGNVFLLSYLLTQPMRHTKRLTVWQIVDNQHWQAVYHQGTVVSDYANQG